ncbi:MAG: glycosyltransferase [Patescibacteria group bacterium]|nr:glycosyltransferase [Patescibacteria group bacterium]
MKKEKKSITIGICAYNEAKNIKNLLDSIIAQKETKDFFIRDIIVVSDGSTDSIEHIVLNHGDPRVQLKFFPTREGKPTRMNYLLSNNQSDILVFFDADVVLAHPFVLKHLVLPFISSKRMGLVGGRCQPLPAETFVESAINNYIDARIAIEDRIDCAKTAYCFHGAIMAMSKEFASKLILPSSIFSDDTYIYLFARRSKYKVYYAKKAVVLYRSPQTLIDAFRQMMRHHAGTPQLYNYFLKNHVDKAFALPIHILLRIAFYQVISNPLGYLFIKCLNYVAQKEAFYRYKTMSVRWNIIHSSKTTRRLFKSYEMS